MKYFIIILSAMFLASCGATSNNDRFYEEVWKPRYKRIAVVDQENTVQDEVTQEETADATTTPKPKVEFIRVEVMNPVYQGIKYLDYTEKENRSELKDLTGVDPVRIEWCAAYVNAILEESKIPSNKNHKHPLTARAFLDWGKKVDKPEMGDIIVFPRGNEGWQGHVGFFVKEQEIDGILYYYILGGNQNNAVRVDLYRADRALGIRRGDRS